MDNDITTHGSQEDRTQSEQNHPYRSIILHDQDNSKCHSSTIHTFKWPNTDWTIFLISKDEKVWTNWRVAFASQCLNWLAVKPLLLAVCLRNIVVSISLEYHLKQSCEKEKNKDLQLLWIDTVLNLNSSFLGCTVQHKPYYLVPCTFQWLHDRIGRYSSTQAGTGIFGTGLAQ